MMATTKDLTEAHAFSRRRLVAAFLHGSPGGRQAEASRPGRTVLGGAALSILLLAGAAIVSVLAPRTPSDWNQPGLVLSREDAALYVILRQQQPPVLHPVVNAASAQLIFGVTAPATVVSRETVDRQTPGATIGIVGAPQTLPRIADLIQTGWTACTGDGLGITLDVERDPRLTLTGPSDPTTSPPLDEPQIGFVVRTVQDGALYLVATGRIDQDGERARAYPVPDDALDRSLSELGLPATGQAIAVPEAWVDLLEPGGALAWDSFAIADPGGPLPAGLAAALDDPAARIGDYLPPAAGSGDPTLVLTHAGPVELDGFAAAIYAHTTVPGTRGPPRALDPDTELGDVGFGPPVYQDAHWPTGRLTQPATRPCVVLEATPGQRPWVRLATAPRTTASAAQVGDPGRPEVRVQPGGGALVGSGSFTEATAATTMLIDARGAAHPMIGDTTLERSGYDDVDPPAVPEAWVTLFHRGVPLSSAAALCPPDPAAAVGAADNGSGTAECAGGGVEGPDGS